MLNWIDTKLGRCPLCMRSAFRSAIALAGVSVVLVLLGSHRLLLATATISAAAAALVWMAHLAAFAMRGVRAANRADQRMNARRRAVLAFGRSFVLAAAMTGLPPSVFAQVMTCSDGCRRFRGTSDCYPCCSTCNQKKVQGCNNANKGNPDGYNKCIESASREFAACNNMCKAAH
jgi:hypothetical protein